MSDRVVLRACTIVLQWSSQLLCGFEGIPHNVLKCCSDIEKVTYHLAQKH